MRPDHEKWMARAIALAERGQGRTSPNPMVGAVLVKDERILATGYHHRVGSDHAEVDCLKKVGFRAPSGSILYVTLEPCPHWGRTPPCTEAIMRSGVTSVVIGTEDPDPQVAGQGVAALRQHSIEVLSEVLGDKCRELNKYYFFHRCNKRPYVVVKAAITIDGKIGMKTGASQWITGVPARQAAHRLRSEVDAILVGRGTVMADDPELTVRLVPHRGPQPIRIILDASLSLPLTAKVFREGRCIVVCTPEALSVYSSPWDKGRLGGVTPIEKYRNSAHLPLKVTPPTPLLSQEGGIEFIALPVDSGGHFPIQKLLRILGKKGILSLLVEGGGHTYSTFVAARCVEEMVLFMAPKLIGDTGAPMLPGWGAARLKGALQFERMAMKPCGEDMMLSLRRRSDKKVIL